MGVVVACMQCFLTDLSHLWVPSCQDKRGKDVL